MPQGSQSKTSSTAAAKPRQGAIRQKNQARILKAAAAEFGKHGFKGTSIQAIADRVELPKANLLYYFGSKTGLYKALLQDILQMWNQAFAEDAYDRAPAVVIRDYILAKMRYSRSHPQCSKIFAMEMIQGAPVIRDDLELGMIEWSKQKCHVIHSWVERGLMQPIEPLYLLFTIWGATQFYADFDAEIALIRGGELNDDEFNQAEAFVVSLILKGLGLTLDE